MPFESVKDFYEAERLLIIAEIQRCFRHIGECDSCEGRPRGCDTSCFHYRKDDHKQVWDWIDLIQFYDFPDYAPIGCSMRWEKIEEPRIDIFEGYSKIDYQAHLDYREANAGELPAGGE